MAFTFLGPDPLELQIDDTLQRIASGEPPSTIETRQVDCKEERGRRGERGVILAGDRENDAAAGHLYEEMACFANTPGGGAIILGVADDGTRIGTELDPEWLRHRIYELSDRQLTVDIRPVDLEGTRLLVLKVGQAIEPVRVNGKIHWRVDDHCVEVDATTWHTKHLHRAGVDWSAQPSGHALDDVSPSAIEIARRFLAEAAAEGDLQAQSLLDATSDDLLRRLNVVGADGLLVNAGSLLFVATPTEGIDYIRRDAPGDDSTNRIRSRKPLIEQLYDVDQAISTANRVLHSGTGLVKGQSRAIPPRAAREAVVNGVVHRDWLTDQPTTVEHTGDMLTVTSPGGFPGSVSSENIITHPSAPRYRTLAEAVATLRLAEREGVGVDRMVRDMLAVGLLEPEIVETAGPAVRASLIGGPPDSETVELFAAFEPASAARDLDIVLIVDHLSRRGFGDIASLAPVIQRPPGETAAAIARANAVTVQAEPIITTVKGVPPGTPDAFRLSDRTRKILVQRTTSLLGVPARAKLIVDWAIQRGRVSSTEIADLIGLSPVRAGQVLTELSDNGMLLPGKEVRGGRGFFYIPA